MERGISNDGTRSAAVGEAHPRSDRPIDTRPSTRSSHVRMPTLKFLSDYPLLALLPAVCFFILGYMSQRTVVWAAGLAWAAFAAYGLLFQKGVLCPFGCDSRVDLLIVYPFLLVISVVGALSALRGRKEVELP